MIKELMLASMVLVAKPSGMPTSDYEQMQEMKQELTEVEMMMPGAIVEQPMDYYEAEVVNGPAAEHLTQSGGVFYGPNGKETYYNLNMSRCIDIMRGYGYSEEAYPYWVRDDGVKMFGSYVMIAADTGVYPKGSIIETSMGTAMVVDHCPAGVIDVCVNW